MSLNLIAINEIIPWFKYLLPLPLGIIELLLGIMVLTGLFMRVAVWAIIFGILFTVVALLIITGFDAAWKLIAIFAITLSLFFMGCGKLGFDTWLD